MKAKQSPFKIARTLGVVAVALALAATTALVGCSPAKTASTSQQTLADHTLNIYCGAGMKDPFQKIADAFTGQTGCKVNVTFANAAQIQTQIKTTGEGDFFIAGSEDELKPIESSVSESTALVKHIPVLVVPANNPSNIKGLADLPNAKKVLVGDPEATPIGKIAKNALTKAGLWDNLMAANVITTTTTAPQISTALASGEGDAGIVWKENVKDGVVIVETSDMDAFVKTIPAAQLSSVKDKDAASAFASFLQSDTAKAIWAEYGYEQA